MDDHAKKTIDRVSRKLSEFIEEQVKTHGSCTLCDALDKMHLLLYGTDRDASFIEREIQKRIGWN